MPQRTAMIGNLPEALEMVRAVRADNLAWGTGCRQAVPQAPAGIIRGGMAGDVDRWLDNPDGRNGTYRRRLPCEPGDIGPERRHRPIAVPGSCPHALANRCRALMSDGVVLRA